MTKAQTVRIAAGLSFLAVLCLFPFALPAAADTIVTASSTYDATPAPGLLTPAGETFSLTFTEPDTFMSLDTTSVPITYTLGGVACSICFPTGEVQFFPLDPSSGQYGLFNVLLPTTDGDTYLWQFFGPQIYSGSGSAFSLLVGTFNINDSSTPPLSTVDDTAFGLGFGLYAGTFTGGTVVVTSTAAVPEPSSLLLLGSGLLGLGALLRRFVCVWAAA